jgi:hypothetical protein
MTTLVNSTDPLEPIFRPVANLPLDGGCFECAATYTYQRDTYPGVWNLTIDHHARCPAYPGASHVTEIVVEPYPLSD